MNRSRQYFLVALLALGSMLGLNVDPASAQDGRGGALIGRIQQELDQLNLTDEQRAKTTEILNNARAQFRDMANELIQAEPLVRRQKLNEFVSGVAEQIKPVLNERQRIEFEQRIQRMRAQRAAASQPQAEPAMTERPGPGPANRPGALLDAFRQAVDSLELSAEQRGLVSQVLADARARFQEIRGQSQGDPQAMREKLMPVLTQAREKVMQILTEPQRARLQELLSDSEPPRRGRPGGGPDGGRAGRPPQMMQDMREQLEAAPTTAPIAEAPEVPGISAVGHPAPDFNLKKLDGQSVQLSSYKGKIVLLVFGSYTSPSFRQRATALERLKREYGTRIYPIIVYTSENHPVGQWEVQRNKDQGISVEQPTDMDGRMALAKRARDALKLTTPLVIDTMDDATSKAYGGTTNAAILIGRDGTILARQKWFEPYALRADIDAALK
jgi:hypothetical protein